MASIYASKQDQDVPFVVTQVLEMDELLSMILKYLKLKDLKTTRLVNYKWEKESQPFFKQKAIVDLCLIPALDKSEVELFRQLINCQENFKMTLTPTDFDVLDYPNKEILHFTISRHSIIKSLFLDIIAHNTEDFKLQFLYLSVLRNLPQLKELKLRVDILYCWEEMDEDDVGEFAKTQPLPFVTKLDMNWDIGLDLNEIDKPKLQKLCKKLLYMTPNLQEVSLVESESHMNKEFVSIYLKEMKQLQSEWKVAKSKTPMPFKNLAFIKLYGFQITSENIILACLELLQPLNGFEMYVEDFCFSAKMFSSTLEKLLNKHATTLEELSITYITEDYNEGVLHLPDLPKLKKLSLEYRKASKLSPHLSVAAFNIHELLMMGAEKFHEKFPQLHSLEMFKPATNIPLPIDLCFPKITSFYSRMRNYQYLSKSDKDWMKWLARLFPNVHSSDLNKARQDLEEEM